MIARLLRSIDEVGLLQAAGVQRLEDVGAHVLRTVAALSRQIVERPGRKAIVGIGVAALFDTPIPPPTVSRSLLPEWTEAMRATASAGVHFYVIDPGGVGSLRPFNGTSGFARETGGLAFLNTNDFDRVVDRIMSELSSYYVIDVADPPVRRTSDLRELEVKVLRRGVTVRARRALLGGPDPFRTAREPRAPSPSPTLPLGVEDAADDVPVDRDVGARPLSSPTR